MTTHININLEPSLAKSFEDITKKKAINKSALVRQWIEEWVRDNKTLDDRRKEIGELP